MAVIVKYIVVRNGDEKMTFVTKKEADAYDKMLDIADNLFDFLADADLKLDERKQEELCLLLAQRREDVMPILRGLSPKKVPDKAAAAPAKKTKSSKSAGAKAKPEPPAKAAAKKSAG